GTRCGGGGKGRPGDVFLVHRPGARPGVVLGRDRLHLALRGLQASREGQLGALHRPVAPDVPHPGGLPQGAAAEPL
ncbi:MAG: hypothetical protein AVDCRST_MAG88-452, partial [uncultured Thermomicrobiales bacterium]